MRHSLLLTMIILLCSGLSAADFIIIEPLTEQPLNLALQKNPRYDVNSEPCALIIISTDISNLKVYSSLNPVEIVYKIGEVWVYLTAGDSQLRFEKQGYASFRYNLPLTLQKNMVYTLRLGTKSGITAADIDLVQLTLNLNQADVYIAKDNTAPILLKEKTAVYKLPKGEHTFRFTKQGFQDKTEKLNVRSDSTLNITLLPGATTTRNKLPGFLTVTSEPTGAEVFVNDQRVGITPLNTDITAGEHSLRVQKAMFDSYQGSFSLAEKETKELPLIKLKPKHGFYSVTSVPTGAKIYLDNKPVGTTPLAKTRIESGEHTLRIETADKLYHPQDKPLTIKNGDDLELKIELLPAFGRLTVKSLPESGANVYLDDVKVGVTPYDNPQQPSGRFLLKVEKEMWKGSEEYINVLDKQTTLREVLLNRDFAEVKVNATGCNIYQNNVMVRKDNDSQRLKPGNYTFKATREKHTDDVQERYLAAGETVDIILAPAPKQGTMAIETSPFASKGAEIWLDDVRQNETSPAILERLIGDYKVAVKHPKYLEQSRQVNLKENDYQKLVFTLESYQGSYLSQSHKWGAVKWASLGTALMVAGLGGYCFVTGDAYYDEYQKSTTTEDAVNNRDQYEKYDKIMDLSIYAVPVPVITYLYSYLKQVRYRKLAKQHS